MAGGAQRVPHRDRPAVDVDLVVRHAHFLHEPHRHGGEGFVDLEQVDLVEGHPGLGQGLACRRHGAGQHDGRVGARQCGRDNAGPRREAMRPACLFAADQEGRRAVDHARRVACVMDMVSRP
jgi:hypothetical protein